MHLLYKSKRANPFFLIFVVITIILTLSLIGNFSFLNNLLMSRLFPNIDKVQAVTSEFVTRDGSNLYLNGQQFKFSGANITWLGLDGALTFPSKFKMEDAILTVKEMGGNVIRSFAVQSVGCPNCVQPSLGQFNEDAFQSIDYAIKVAKDNDMRVMFPLVDNWHYNKGGKHTYTDWRGISNEDEFFTNPQVIQDFKNHINYVLNHVNPYTGLAYKDDPTIMAWSTGSEIRKFDGSMDNTWTQNIAQYIKSIAPNQLVIDGHATAVGSNIHLTPGALQIPEIDIYDGHFYPPSVSFMEQDAQAAKQANKVYFIGEYDWSDWRSKQAQASASQDSTTKQEGNYSAKVNITTTNFYDWHIQLTQQNRVVEVGKSYTVSFWAKASENREARIGVRKTASPYTSYFAQTIDLTTSWQQYSFTYTQPVSDSVSLSFTLGQNVGQIWVDNVSFLDGSTNLIQNPSFENTGSSWLSPWILQVTTNTADTASELQAAVENPINNVAGDFYWTLYGHNDTRGFWYQGDIEYVLHYLGDTVDMRNRAQQIRSHAFSLRGLTALPHGTSSIPQLTQITASGSGKLVDFRGAVAADKYSIERSANGSSSWQEVASNLTAYNSPWFDSSATAGEVYSYRVKAINFDSSQHSYSNVEPELGNMVQNRSFEHTGPLWDDPWSLNLVASASATISQDTSTYHQGGNAAKVDIIQGSTSKNHVQLTQKELVLKAGKSYTVSFWAKASQNRSAQVVISQTGTPFTSYFSQNFDLIPSWQQYSYDFLASVDNPNVSLRFSLAEATGQVWIDDVLITVPTPTPTPTPLPSPSPTPDTQPPTVSITSPANNSNVPRNSNVTIQASASDQSGISKVEFYVNGTLNCTDTTSPYACTWDVPAPKNKTYTIQAKAYDTVGNTSTSSISVTSK